MKLIVFSDSHHRNVTDMLAVIRAENPDVVLHLGDVVEDVDDIRSVFPDLQIYQVCGNNDFGWQSDGISDNLVVCAEQVRIFITHGHLFGVRRNTKMLAKEARKNNCQAALYGHTHRAGISQEDDILIANPGSISLPYTADPPSYLRLTVTGNTIEPKLFYLENRKKKHKWYYR